MEQYSNVSLLVTHYNRSESLLRLIRNFDQLEMWFSEIVVSDDGSKPEHVKKLKDLERTGKIRLVTTPVNKGLGNNINKGQDEVKSEYTLYVQEDFIPQPLLKEKLHKSVKFMNEDQELDMVRLYAFKRYPTLLPFKEGFCKMRFNFWLQNYEKLSFYSDHPHLRRSNFMEKFGRYPEGLNPEKTEYKMMMSVLKKKGKSLFYYNHHHLFHHVNSEHEPSTMKKNFWRKSQNFGVAGMRHVYRHLKGNIEYLFGSGLK